MSYDARSVCCPRNTSMHIKSQCVVAMPISGRVQRGLQKDTGCAAFLAPGLCCRPKEYPTTNGQCCPMCSEGTIVQRDCTSRSGTRCSHCKNGTFMNQPNGMGHGLFALHVCSDTTDTVCEVIDGYFCKHFDATGCSAAQTHTQCVPGERIKEPGTSREDAQCEPCPSGFFSEHGVNCTDWTTCSGTQATLKEGSSITDVVCGDSSRNHDMLILSGSLFVALVVSLLVALGIKVKQMKLSSAKEQTP
ncbi:tumor necrosis factor receptor superfamily member 14-like isoform X2 [Pseudochaenichthys georgianus]|uniref:tumor necrosis factor receptor superfamily member 14-like isoform X2 n=1 Tax=Pseudochaenichthys georgianus TaxID=52239 RepID=UPI00146D0F61|nr:tumor necrosis factor receptor superfamily member 14-like isoform X2 [Pseudochaenichthys georgianus]